MKTVEEIIKYLENEIEWTRKCAQGYLTEYMKADEAFSLVINALNIIIHI